VNRRTIGLAAGVLALAVLAVGVGVAAAKSQASAQAAFPSFPGLRLLGLADHVASELALTDSQRDQMKQVIKAQRSAIAPLVDRLAAARQELRGAIWSQAGEGTIRQKSATVAAVEADLAVARAQTLGQLKAVLTPEQQVKAEAMRARAEQFCAALRAGFRAFFDAWLGA